MEEDLINVYYALEEQLKKLKKILEKLEEKKDA